MKIGSELRDIWSSYWAVMNDGSGFYHEDRGSSEYPPRHIPDDSSIYRKLKLKPLTMECIQQSE
jgi:hypothetical protein